MKKEWALICSNYINAYSLIISLKALGWQGPIVCIKHQSRGTVLTEMLRDDVQTWCISVEQPADLLYALAERVPTTDPKTVFFCDERFHEAFREQGAAMLPNSRFLLGSTTHLDFILDRFLFYDFIVQRHLAPAPRTIAGDQDPWREFEVGFFIRPNKTWDGLRRLPRVQLVHTSEEQQRVEADLRGRGLTSHDWCYQEILSLDPRDNVSICGWHAPEERLYFATHHLLRHPNEVGNGDVTELLAPPPGLFQSTQRVLDALHYEGPFELEYVRGQLTNEYKVIELNPRFWMQHGLIEAVTDHALVQRYLGAVSKVPTTTEKRYWVNTFYVLYRMIRGDWRGMRYALNRGAVMAPESVIALKYLPTLIHAGLWPEK